MEGQTHVLLMLLIQNSFVGIGKSGFTKPLLKAHLYVQINNNQMQIKYWELTSSIRNIWQEWLASIHSEIRTTTGHRHQGWGADGNLQVSEGKYDFTKRNTSDLVWGNQRALVGQAAPLVKHTILILMSGSSSLLFFPTIALERDTESKIKVNEWLETRSAWYKHLPILFSF